jgi:hypothetical protein
MRTVVLTFVAIILAGIWQAVDAPVVWAQRERAVRGWQGEALRYGWKLDYEAAREEARRVDKPLMVVLRCVP